MRSIIIFVSGWILLFTANAHANFDSWKEQFAQDALAKGISESTVQQFLQHARPYQKAINRDNTQAEFKKFLWDYLTGALSTKRIENGNKKLLENRTLLNEIAIKTGVSAEIITAIWGMETNYGNYTGKVPLASALATLAHDSRRSQFFSKELLAFLQLIDRGDIPSIEAKGSWAGGMGMTQFIPTTYHTYAVDYDNDGHRNLWQKHDALASTASYLQAMGWVPNLHWGQEVQLPEGFNYYLANDKKNRRPLSYWRDLGIKSANGQPLTGEIMRVRLYVPAGQFGPKFLLYKNFDVIKRYNNSDAYALAVSLLSDQISNRPGLTTPWPNNAKKLTVNDIKIVQSALNAYGFDAGKVDGIMGSGTRRALQNYQMSQGLVADGFLTVPLYRRLVTGIK